MLAAMKTPVPSDLVPARVPPQPGPIRPRLSLRRTLADHQKDPLHHFHPPGHRADGRVTVAAGERLQRVRGRAHAG